MHSANSLGRRPSWLTGYSSSLSSFYHFSIVFQPALLEKLLKHLKIIPAPLPPLPHPPTHTHPVTGSRPMIISTWHFLEDKNCFKSKKMIPSGPVRHKGRLTWGSCTIVSSLVRDSLCKKSLLFVWSWWFAETKLGTIRGFLPWHHLGWFLAAYKLSNSNWLPD